MKGTYKYVYSIKYILKESSPLTGSVKSIHVRLRNFLKKAFDSAIDFGNGSRAFRAVQWAIDCDWVFEPVLTAQYFRPSTSIRVELSKVQLDTFPSLFVGTIVVLTVP